MKRLFVLTSILSGVFTVALASPSRGQEVSRCPQAVLPAPSQPPPAPGAPGPPVTLTPEKKALVIPFQAFRGIKTREVPIDADGEVAEVGLRATIRGDILRTDGVEVFPKGASQVTINYSVEPGPGGSFITANLCLDPKNPEEVVPGTYTGSLLVFGTGVTPTTVGLTVTLRHPSFLVPAAASILGAGLGLLLKWLADSVKDKRQTKRELILSLVLGGGAAIYFAFGAYFRDDTFGDGGILDLAAVMGTAFGAVISGSTAADLVSGLIKKSR